MYGAVLITTFSRWLALSYWCAQSPVHSLRSLPVSDEESKRHKGWEMAKLREQVRGEAVSEGLWTQATFFFFTLRLSPQWNCPGLSLMACWGGFLPPVELSRSEPNGLLGRFPFLCFRTDTGIWILKPWAGYHHKGNGLLEKPLSTQVHQSSQRQQSFSGWHWVFITITKRTILIWPQDHFTREWSSGEAEKESMVFWNHYWNICGHIYNTKRSHWVTFPDLYQRIMELIFKRLLFNCNFQVTASTMCQVLNWYI